MRKIVQACLTVGILALVGCAPESALPKPRAEQPGVPVTLPNCPYTYKQLAEEYNRNIDGLDRLWARTVAVLEWQQHGERRVEQGEGNLIVVLPDRLALSIGKLGSTAMWAGANAQAYWLYDQRDGGVMSHGQIARLGQPGTQPLPAPVSPLDLPRLLAMVKINPEAAPAEPAVEYAEGGWLIQPPGTNAKIVLDVTTLRPRQIHLADAQGRSVVVAELEEYQRVATEGRSPANWPWIATRVKVTTVGKDGKLTLHLADQSDGKPDRIKDAAFDLDRLKNALKPARVVDLDAPPEASTPVVPAPVVPTTQP